MDLLIPHRLPLPLLLAILVAAWHGVPSSGDGGYDASMCVWQPYTCGDVSIKYPFYSKTGALLGNESSYCGYPGLEILCDEEGRAFLELESGNYTVTSIDYELHTVRLVDPEVLDDRSCPRADHNVTLWNFSWLYYPNGTVDYLVFFINCNFLSSRDDCPVVALAQNVTVPPGSALRFTTADASLTFLVGCGAALPSPRCLEGAAPIRCDDDLGGGAAGERSYVFRGATANATDAGGAIPGGGGGGGECARSCRGTVTVQVYAALFDVPSLSNLSSSYGTMLRNGFELGWDASFDARCALCESSGGWCSYNRTSAASGGGGGALAFGCVCPDGRTRPSHCAFLLLLFLAYLLHCKRIYGSFIFWRKRSYVSPRVKAFLERYGSLHPKVYSYAEVKRMTKSFTYQLGEGGCGVVYKGRLPDGRLVAVKMLKELKGDDERFMNEITTAFDASEMAKGAGELVRKMIVVGLWCVQVMPIDRPSMSQVVEMLENDMKDLIQLPSKPMTSSYSEY
ncbi:unnamed protein product [Urochloa decumbens]|uniref:Uncharacterized protein n=1 Tax=Urochloa decumbens TaxID=240449 RepID=A0ABC8Z3U3_9POAL